MRKLKIAMWTAILITMLCGTIENYFNINNEIVYIVGNFSVLVAIYALILRLALWVVEKVNNKNEKL